MNRRILGRKNAKHGGVIVVFFLTKFPVVENSEPQLINRRILGQEHAKREGGVVTISRRVPSCREILSPSNQEISVRKMSNAAGQLSPFFSDERSVVENS